jgi:hypothetical protein
VLIASCPFVKIIVLSLRPPWRCYLSVSEQGAEEYIWTTEELHDLYSSPSIIRMIKLRNVRLEGYVARMGAKRNAYRLLVGKARGKETTRKTKT